MKRILKIISLMSLAFVIPTIDHFMVPVSSPHHCTAYVSDSGLGFTVHCLECDKWLTNDEIRDHMRDGVLELGTRRQMNFKRSIYQKTGGSLNGN